MEQTLLDLTKQIFNEAHSDSDFDLNDYGLFSNLVDEIEKIESMKLKPHLIKWHMNMWEHHRNYVESALELLGYEYVGKMDICDDENQFKFEYSDFEYDTLFRFKGKNADYTNILTIN
jgi:hypothetical protein